MIVDDFVIVACDRWSSGGRTVHSLDIDSQKIDHLFKF